MINWRVRIANKHFWLALIPALLLLVQAAGRLFGLTLDFGELGNTLKEIINDAFSVLVIIGIVNDPTTDGLGDSNRAMTYDVPYKDRTSIEEE